MGRDRRHVEAEARQGAAYTDLIAPTVPVLWARRSLGVRPENPGPALYSGVGY